MSSVPAVPADRASTRPTAPSELPIFPTGLVVSQQDQKSQLQNKLKALEVLRARLLDRMIAEQEATAGCKQAGHGGDGRPSAKIRTYNFPQSRVTDHRINLSVHNLDDVINGRIDELVKRSGWRAGRSCWVIEARPRALLAAGARPAAPCRSANRRAGGLVDLGQGKRPTPGPPCSTGDAEAVTDGTTRALILLRGPADRRRAAGPRTG